LSKCEYKKHNREGKNLEKKMYITLNKWQMALTLRKGENFHKYNEERAVGLWLWDYIKTNIVSENTAVNELCKKYKEFNIETEDPESIKFEHNMRKYLKYLKNTKDCIDKCEIISLN
ncbi:hypothetical protein ACFL4Q_02865, partial [candidate division KSB1 bacterium]